MKAVPQYNGRAEPGVYRGFCLRGKPEGRGEWVGDEGDMYAGEWHGGQQHGHGKESFSGGSIHWGAFCEGRWHGDGVSVDPDGTVYYGKWVGGGMTYDLVRVYRPDRLTGRYRLVP